ncbi:MAG: hypothetical protein H0T79_06845 [Deltaproteobacteria bacterium]|nr:hypothetical protein [Deltaproteobacteria bacterium]
MAIHSRKLLIAGSLVVHGALAFGLFVSGVWKLERLDPERRTLGLAVMEPPAAAGSPLGAQVAPKLVPKIKKVVIKELRQPTLAPTEPAAPTVATAATGNGERSGAGSGSGSNPDGDDTSTGTCVGPACGDAGQPSVPAPHIPPPRCPNDPTGQLVYPACAVVVPPTVLKGLRLSGDTNVMPSDVVKTRMLRDGNTRSTGVFKVCITASGGIQSVAQSGTTRYPEYDAALAGAIRGWRYDPYRVGGHAVAACGVVTFVYTIK